VTNSRPASIATQLAVAAAGGLVILASPRVILHLTRRPQPA
jgi:hypothetical protein